MSFKYLIFKQLLNSLNAKSEFQRCLHNLQPSFAKVYHSFLETFAWIYFDNKTVYAQEKCNKNSKKLMLKAPLRQPTEIKFSFEFTVSTLLNRR